MEEVYDYRQAVRDDVKSWVDENIELVKKQAKDMDKDELAEWMRDYLWDEDCVTGNASGSYTFNAWVAEENLCHNTDLLLEAISDFEPNPEEFNAFNKGPEWCDVTIRLYLMPGAVDEVLDELEDEIWPDEDEEDEYEEDED